ncbi:hypothetical protein AWH56_008425 [Anaerobacillus isosaccharinicus]|uniref:Uncharacterized protein n=1 Tax=Anaerobacillus isosaccharinicus TaxID=1532552 RepID=A0A1S2LFV9_9BACI|nr:hypothetical protein [Anaerobacillus isosaccharinicus]MBA5583990.1 hypothetical protein [Anaerobacillus isosaccharinicus]MBA5587042.1 hypothetical protein [Anaerobacillus isosaccharinicus]MBA5587095.1 hypothetical protein [Anaerobacillus isosaccharinicus]QOY34709.1 hypothetical protein AWH56_018550 [Anaerobacillus isosaccharinicus]QOY34759.1 hypothetical protein AWH56_018810 [Anaerobacillus isosaccharinicus]
MNMTISEAAKILSSEYGMESNGIRVDEAMVEKWVLEGLIKASTSESSITINENDLHFFVEASKSEGTPYEIGISDQVKIERLFGEIRNLKKENEKLKEENRDYALKLGIELF